jgi:hypothetical protein
VSETEPATVVNLKGHRDDKDFLAEVVYIGRPMYLGGWRLPGSIWANPYRIGRDGTREEVLARYEQYVRESPELLLARLPELAGRRLGCWCAPLPCHGDVLVRLLAEIGTRRPVR